MRSDSNKSVSAIPGGIHTAVTTTTNAFNNDYEPTKTLLWLVGNERNNISVDPLFINPSNGDYHLSQASPVRDRGDNSAPSLPLEDFEGQPRISEGMVDIGADEYSSITVSFSANPVKGLIPLTVNFMDQSSAIQGSIVAWAWDFNNDGTTDSTTKTPSFTYGEIGIYSVRLMVTDSSGTTNTMVKEGYITAGDTTDSDGDDIIDVMDNCTNTYNPVQLDLDGDGIGDACDKYVDLLANAGYSSGLKSPSAKELSPYDVTATMKDGILDIGSRVALNKGKYNIMSFRSNVNATKLSTLILNVYASSLYNGTPQVARIYAYSADGMSVQATKYLDISLTSGWNNLNLTPLLHLMDGFGFVNFRVTAVKNWFEISEAYFNELTDAWKIDVAPSKLEFGAVAVGTSKTLSMVVSNSGNGNLKIAKVTSPSSPFSITSDGCTGVTLSASATCTVTVNFSQNTVGTFFDSLEILSNDADHPTTFVRLAAVPPAAILSGTVTDGHYPLAGVTVTVTDPMVTFITKTASSEIPVYNGTFSLHNLTPGSFTATFEKSGYIKMTINGSLNAGQNTLDVQLSPLPPLSLSITSPQADPREEHNVTVNSSPVAVTGTVSNNANVSVNSIQALVNGNTFSAFVPLNEGQNTLTATAIDQYNQTASQSMSVTLITKGAISGTVNDSSTGLPLSSATITVIDALNTPLTALTDSGGQYTISGVAPGTFSGDIRKDGLSSYNFTGTISPGQTIIINTALSPILPTIDNIASINIAADSATISWTTDQPSDSLVEYGETTAYGNTASDGGLVTAHAITLNNLSPNRNYHFKVTSKNTYNNSASSGDQTFTTLSPPPPAISSISASNITYNAAVITWTTDQLTSSIVEYGTSTAYGSSVSDSALTTEHSIQIQNLTSGTIYHFKIIATNAYASSSYSEDSTFMTVSPITINISLPVNNEVINRPDVLVKGTITNSTGNETGVTVNGIVATVYGNKFIANHVPLSEGTNTITITATDTAGNIKSASTNLTAVTTGNYIRVTSNIESVISPLQVMLRADGSFSITESNISVSGPGAVEFLPGDRVDEYEIRMTTEGTYYFTVSVPGPDNVVYQDTAAITVLNKTQLDTLLKAKWEGMKGALINRNIEGSLMYFHDGSKESYRQAFNLILDDLPQIVSDMLGVEMIYVKDNLAKYRINRNQNIDQMLQTFTYYIYFVRDRHGVWKLNRF